MDEYKERLKEIGNYKGLQNWAKIQQSLPRKSRPIDFSSLINKESNLSN